MDTDSGMDAFNPHGNRTADGVLIVEGLRVFTNNMDRGVVVGKAYDGDFGRETDWWWQVRLDSTFRGEPLEGAVDMNGERLATRFEGRRA